MATKRKRKRTARAIPLRIKEAVLRRVVAEGRQPDHGTPERSQHGEVDRDVHARVVSRVERLHLTPLKDAQGVVVKDASGAVVMLISRVELDACNRFYSDYALGVERVYEPPAGYGGASSPDAGEIRFLAALLRYRKAATAVGVLGTQVLDALVCRDLSWPKIGLALGCDRETARKVAIIIIRELAAHYAELDGGRKPLRAPRQKPVRQLGWAA